MKDNSNTNDLQTGENAMELMPFFMNTQEVARYTNTSESLWEKFRADGKGPSWVRIGRAARMNRAVLDAWLAAQVAK